MKRSSTLLFFITLLCTLQIHAACWQVLLYMDSSDELSDMAIKNITDALYADKDDSVEFFIQLHAYDQVALRYIVTSQGLSFMHEQQLSDSPKDNLIASAQWAFAHTPADYHMLIFWNHGWGILDPQWNEAIQEWQVHSEQADGVCSIKRSRLNMIKHKKSHKGFMFSMSPRTYLSTPAMGEALADITQHTLKGKKIDIVAFDTCMGGMLEVAYEIMPYASYLIGNQVCALRDGFDYTGLLKALNKSPKPKELAQDMVRVFDDYYEKHDPDGIYAHIALDLSVVPCVADALGAVVKSLSKIDDGVQFALEAHKAAPRFCIFPMYTDLISYIKHIEAQVAATPKTLQTNELLAAIKLLYQAMGRCVVARCAGFANYDKTHGCAIYAPMYALDNSYLGSQFAKETQWCYLLEAVGNSAKCG